MSRHLLTLGCIATASLTIALAGCASTSTRLGSIRANPAPELHSLSRTRNETKNILALTRATNIRNSRSAIRRAFYLDRPSRLTPSPIPY